MAKRAIIIGAGPAGLTAALELLRRTDVQPVVLEASGEIGGISRTIRYKGNRMDIGGHRFFSKSDRVMQWWMELMPPVVETTRDGARPVPVEVTYHGGRRLLEVPAVAPQHPPLRGMGPLAVVETDPEGLESPEAGSPEQASNETPGTLVVEAPEPEDADRVMLVRPRQSRIYYLRRFFEYPIQLTGATLRNLGLVRMARIGVSYLKARLWPIRPERSLQDFLINRFGRELYLTFFKSYTEKVWGVPCAQISAEWGAQRIKGLSLTTAVRHFFQKLLTRRGKAADKGDRAQDVAQKKTDTSLIERFLYPKFGPGQLWEHVAEKVVAGGGEVHLGWTVDRVEMGNGAAGDAVSGHVSAVEAVNEQGERQRFEGEIFLSTMPIQELTRALERGGTEVPSAVREVSEGLQYRDFITVGVLTKRLAVSERDGGLLRDTWIYIQEPDVQLGRLQIFNNWSPFMVADPDKVWLGLEYFCYATDPLWSMPDEALQRFAVGELEKIGILKTSDVLDTHVVRVPKTYPAYFGTYNRFEVLRQWLDRLENLYLVGRNGMHKYNNQDHSMLTAMAVVDGIVAGKVDKAALWSINTEQTYHEEKGRR